MALWIVHSWGGIETIRGNLHSPVAVIARHADTWEGQLVTAELIDVGPPTELAFLRAQRHVLALEPAHDGAFADVAEGAIVISGDGTSRQPAPTP